RRTHAPLMGNLLRCGGTAHGGTRYLHPWDQDWHMPRFYAALRLYGTFRHAEIGFRVNGGAFYSDLKLDPWPYQGRRMGSVGGFFLAGPELTIRVTDAVRLPIFAAAH